MSSFEIKGGNRLNGEIIPQGAKNEALQVICSCLLTSEKVILHNIPDINDVNKLIDLLRDIGVSIENPSPSTFIFQAANIDIEYLKSSLFKDKVGSLRGSIMILGPLLARFGRGYIYLPGGDKIGRRRLDTHFIGMQNLGAKIEYSAEDQYYTFTASELKGANMLLDEASVTGTANIVMASVLAKGKTVIFNAACEPYLYQLCSMLNSMGAQIEGIGSNLLSVNGVDHLGGCEHTLLSDMIEVGSFIGLAAMTRSEITIKNVNFQQLGMIPDVFRKLGINIVKQGDDIFIPQCDHYE